MDYVYAYGPRGPRGSVHVARILRTEPDLVLSAPLCGLGRMQPGSTIPAPPDRLQTITCGLCRRAVKSRGIEVKERK